MKPKKLLILLPDGIGLRNFAFTSFLEIGQNLGWEIVFWNNTPFDLQKEGLREVKLQGKPLAITDILKRAKIQAELDYFTRIFNDPVYQSYKFPSVKVGLKQKVKNALVSFFASTSGNEGGLKMLKKKMKAAERRSVFYKECVKTLEKEKPDFVFCTNQRPVNAIAPLTAAQDLGIPTGTFIFSWDNLPKATMVVEADYYFVWSENMKQELINYYPEVLPENVFITGSPQFEPHFDLSLRMEKQKFFREHELDIEKKYICFSGDDITTSPDDPQYLLDVAEAVVKINSEGNNLGIIFRRCPVDFSDRYDHVLEKYPDLIVPIKPEWKQTGGNWSSVFPAREDIGLLINTILHSCMVINLGSSMVFDFAIFGKPCLYINYDAKVKANSNWSHVKIYNYVHFRSMPTKDAVAWVNSMEELQNKIKSSLSSSDAQVEAAQAWFEKINTPPAERSSIRIWQSLGRIVNS